LIAASGPQLVVANRTRHEKQGGPNMPLLRFSELSAPRQALIRRCQTIRFGKIVRFSIRDREPVMLPETEVFLDVKLDGADDTRPEQGLGDFVLKSEVIRLFAQLDAIRNAAVERLEVRGGIPRRVVFKDQI
jgi:hypothetical protein